MKKFICCLVLTFLFAASFSQRVYFVYLQSEPEQTFYVKIRDNVFSSTSSGYLILSKLRDSSYSFSVGFPQNKWPEQQFKVDIRSKDHGYLLKNFGEKGWGLFDLQTLSVQMGASDNADKAAKTEMKDVSAFTDVLSKAANDPSLRENPIAIKKETPPVQPVFAKNEETVKKDSAIVAKVSEPVVKKETPPAPKETVTEKKIDSALLKDVAASKKEDTPAIKDPVVTTKKEEVVIPKETVAIKKEDPPAVKDPVIKKEDLPVAKETIAEKKEDIPVVNKEVAVLKTEVPKTEPINEYKPSVVKRRSESSTSEGFGLTFIDEYPEGKKDTIRIVIPNSRSVKMIMREQPQKEQPKEQPKEEKKFLDITADTKDVSGDDKNGKETKAKATSCSQASESDFLKLRKKMAAESKDDGMVSEAAKYFKSKCFTVAQLKNLSTLFLNDAGKYKFFDAAYSHVFDPDNFTSLQSELKDEYYINRFKAMLR